MDVLNTEHAFAGRRGQSLLELLLAVGISALLIGGVAVAIALALRVDMQSRPVQGALFVAQGLTDEVATLAESNWRGNIDTLSVAPAQYDVSVSDGAFAIAAGSGTVIVDGVTYTRYFTVEPVYRDTSGVIVESGTLDPSTKKIAAVASWQTGTATTQFTVVKYVARASNISFGQTDWSGGAGQSGGFIASDKYDAADAGIDASEPGVIQLRLQ